MSMALSRSRSALHCKRKARSIAALRRAAGLLTPKRFLSGNLDFATSRRDARQLLVGQE